MNRLFRNVPYYLQLGQTLVKRKAEIRLSLGVAEGEERGQMGSTRMEEQKLMTQLVAVNINNEDAIGKKKELMKGEGREMREGHNRRKRQKERDKKREEGKYSRKRAGKNMSLFNL